MQRYLSALVSSPGAMPFGFDAAPTHAILETTASNRDALSKMQLARHTRIVSEE